MKSSFCTGPMVQYRPPIVWRLFAEPDDAALADVRREVRRRLRAGQSGDALAANPFIAYEILADPLASIPLFEKAGRPGHALYLAARAGEVGLVAQLAEKQLGREKDPARKLAAAVLLGEALLTLG